MVNCDGSGGGGGGGASVNFPIEISQPRLSELILSGTLYASQEQHISISHRNPLRPPARSQVPIEIHPF